jgi:hypothetical protein
LAEDRQFRRWMMGHVRQNSEVLKASKFFKKAIMENSELAWRFCSLLISSLVEMGNDTGAQSVPIFTPSPLHTPPNK